MPLPIYQQSPWQEAAQGAGQLGGTLQSIMVDLARQRYQQQMAQQELALRYQQAQAQQELMRQHGQLYQMQAAKQAGDLALGQNKLQAGGVMGDVLEQIANPIPNMHPGTAAMLQGIAVNQAARLAAQGQQHVPVNLAQLLQLQNPRMQQLMATGTKAVVPLSSQGGAYDPITSAITSMMPQHLSQGQALVPGQGGAPIAFGLPPRIQLDQPQRELSSWGNILGKVTSGGIPVDPNDPTYQMATNRIGQLGQQLAQPKAQSAQGALPRVQTREDFDRLAKGDKYIGRDGKTYMKP